MPLNGTYVRGKYKFSVCSEYGFSKFYRTFLRRLYAREGIWYAEVFILYLAHGVVGQHLYPAHRFKRVDKGAGTFEVLLAVGYAGDEHLPYPYILAVIRKVPCKRQLVFVARAGELPAPLAVYVLDVEKEQVGIFQKFCVLLQALFACGVEGDSRRVDGGMHAVRFQQAKKFGNEVDLQQRFAARYGHPAAAAPVVFVAQRAPCHLFGGIFAAAARVPAVGIVAVFAPERTALHEYHIAYPRAVDRAETFEGMDTSLHTSPQTAKLRSKKGQADTLRYGRLPRRTTKPAARRSMR